MENKKMEKKKAEDAVAALARQDELLRVMNEAAMLLLTHEAEQFEQALLKSMKMMAECVSVDQIHIWKNIYHDGVFCYSELFEWQDDAGLHQGAREAMAFSYEESMPGWEKRLYERECINGPIRSLPKEERLRLLPYGIVSILVIPVFLQDKFWGFVSFDDCREERVFTQNDVDILKSGSLLLVNAIVKHEMAEELREALAQAVKASKAKGDFLSNMSHEIRTPLNAIIGMTAIGKSASDLGKKDYALEKIENASAHLLGVINDILDLSKIEANKLELSPAEFDFEKMLQKVVNVVNFRVEEKGQKFHVRIDQNIPRTLVGDDQRLSQVITNLLSNAVKFTPNGGSIYLSADLAKEEKGVCTIRVNVTDTGIGMTKEQQSRLFTSFEQAENETSRKFGGTGLGLAISKRLVEMMDGSIWIESELGKGATFAFTIQTRRSEKKCESLLDKDVSWGNVRVLVVDDAPEVLEYFKELARQFGIACDAAASADDALNLINKNGSYNIYFVDLKMPVVDGLELTRRIKEYGAKKSVVIMISSTDWNEIEEDAKAAGVDKFLSKPIFPSSVADCISECLGRNVYEQIDDVAIDDEIDNFEGHCILLAEDVDINREIVQVLLEPTKICIDCAENGQEAVQLFSSAPDRYEMIFMDVQMPKMDGYEATREIRALSVPWAKDIPIVAMTANVFREDIEKCLAAGMNDRLGKPLDTDDMLGKLRKYLKE